MEGSIQSSIPPRLWRVRAARGGVSGRSVSAWPAGEGGAGRRPESTLTDAAGIAHSWLGGGGPPGISKLMIPFMNPFMIPFMLSL